LAWLLVVAAVIRIIIAIFVGDSRNTFRMKRLSVAGWSGYTTSILLRRCASHSSFPVDLVVWCSYLDIGSLHIGRACRLIFVDVKHLVLFVIKVLAWVGSFVLDTFDEAVQAYGYESTE